MELIIYPHGSYGGTQAHRRRGETPCELCRIACNVYMANHRRENPAYRQREIDRLGAGDRARRRLAAEYPERFEQLRVEELLKIQRRR